MAGSEADKRLLERVAGVYKWLDLQVCSGGEMAGVCGSCGDCCDFEAFDHCLFITPPEIIYLVANSGSGTVKPMPGGRCPYNVDGRCTVYEYRFSGCRIFCCSADEDFQSELSEAVLDKLKSICVEFQIPYRYTELAVALNAFTAI